MKEQTVKFSLDGANRELIEYITGELIGHGFSLEGSLKDGAYNINGHRNIVHDTSFPVLQNYYSCEDGSEHDKKESVDESNFIHHMSSYSGLTDEKIKRLYDSLCVTTGGHRVIELLTKCAASNSIPSSCIAEIISTCPSMVSDHHELRRPRKASVDMTFSEFVQFIR